MVKKKIRKIVNEIKKIDNRNKLEITNSAKYEELKKLKLVPRILISNILIRKIKKRANNEPGKIFFKILVDIFLANSKLLAPITWSILIKLKFDNRAALTIFITKNEKRTTTNINIINITDFILLTMMLISYN